MTPIELLNQLDAGMWRYEYDTALQGFLTTDPTFAFAVQWRVTIEGPWVYLNYLDLIELYDVLEEVA